MIKVSVVYPNKPGARFDLDYYAKRHMPMAIDRISAHPGFRGASVEHGLQGGAPGSEAPFIAMGHFLFESMADVGAAFAPHAAELKADIANYTDIEPVRQISEILTQR